MIANHEEEINVENGINNFKAVPNQSVDDSMSSAMGNFFLLTLTGGRHFLDKFKIDIWALSLILEANHKQTCLC